MNHIKEEIPVFFTIDDNYTPWLAVAINSLIINASPKYEYRIIVLHQGLKEESTRRIASLAKPGFVIEFIPMREKFEGITDDFMGNKLRADYFTLTIYFRLFIPTMFPQYDKGIYLDSDIVVAGDISELCNTDLGENLIGACPDFSIQEIPDFVNYVTRYIGCARSIEYINSGILLMNLKALREKNLGSRFLELLNQYHFDCIAPDQDYLNALCMGKIHFLSEEWDAMPNDSKPELKAPKIIHYNLFAKPWCYDGIQYDKQFWQYAFTSGYIDDIILFKRNYTDEQKASDTACAQGLVNRAAMLAVKENNTFSMIFGNGQEERL